MKDSIRKQADATPDAAPSAVINTMVNPFAGIAGGKYYVPRNLLDSSGKPLLSDNPQFNSTVFRLAALTAAYGGGAATLRYILNSARERSRDSKRRAQELEVLKKTNPAFTPDPSLTDDASERRFEERGIPEDTNPLSEDVDMLRAKARKGFRDAMSMMRLSAKHSVPHAKEAGIGWFEHSIPVVGAVGAAAGGIYAADKLQSMKRRKALEEQLDRLYNELDYVNYRKLMLARKPLDEDDGHPPEQAQPKEASLSDFILGNRSKSEIGSTYEKTKARNASYSLAPAAPAQPEEPESGTMTALKSLVLLMGATTFGTSALLTKKYFDANDPARKEKAVMEAALKEKLRKDLETQPIGVAELPASVASPLDAHLYASGRRKARPAPQVRPFDSQEIQASTAPVNTVI